MQEKRYSELKYENHNTLQNSVINLKKKNTTIHVSQIKIQYHTICVFCTDFKPKEYDKIMLNVPKLMPYMWSRYGLISICSRAPDWCIS
jgi:ABC-type antimicrobial peptide transport system permease subunit